MRQVQENAMNLEIYMTGGIVLPVKDSFEETMAILDNRIVGPDEYIVLSLQEGGRTACRKKDIIGLGEYKE